MNAPARSAVSVVREPWALTLGLVTALAAIYLAFPNPVVGNATSAIVGGVALFALLWGPHHHGVADLRPWALLFCAVIAAAISVATRPSHAEALTGPSEQALEASAAILSNVLMLAAAALLVRNSWHGHKNKYVTLDATMMSLAVASLYLSVLALPVLNGDDPLWRKTTAAMYPLFDIGFILCLIALTFTTAPRLPAFRWLAAALGARLVGDFGHAYLASQGVTEMPPVFDIPIMLTAGFAAIAALHPSVAKLNDVRMFGTQPWDRPRLLLIGAAVLLPGVASLIPHGYDLAAQIARAAGAVGVGMFLLFRAVAAVNSQARIQADLEQRSTHDALTRLGNRDMLMERVNRMLERPGPDSSLSLLFVDIDEFKLINDSYSHTVGDEILYHVARRLEAAASEIPTSGMTVTRVGGDQFAVCLHDDADGTLGEQLAAAIVEGSRPALKLAAGRVACRVSVGMSNSRQLQKPTFASLIREADNALEEARTIGAGWSRFTGDTNGEKIYLGLDTALRDAIENEQLRVEFQPVVRLADRQRVRVEATVRWDHPQFGAVPSETIVRLVDEFGLAGKLMHAVTNAVAEEMAQAPGVPLTLHLPGKLLHSGAIVDHIANVFGKHRVNLERLWVMVPEATLSSSLPVIGSTLAGLRSLGVGVGILDFGEGPGTLDALRIVPVDTIRLGPRIVDRIGRSGTERVVRAVVAVAETFDVSVVAAGIETAEQEQALARSGVEYGSGKLLGWPTPNIDLDAHSRT